MKDNGYEVACVSLPSFVGPDCEIRRTYAQEGVETINIDSMNTVVPHSLRDRNRAIPDGYIWQLLLQSQRLETQCNTSMVERVVLIRDIYSGCIGLLKKRRIDVVLFGGLPHSLADYILYIAALQLGIKMRIFQDFPAYPGGCIAYYGEHLNPIKPINMGGSVDRRSYHKFVLDTMLNVQAKLKEERIMRFYQPDLAKEGEWSGVYTQNSNNLEVHSYDEYGYRARWKTLSSGTRYRRYIAVFLHAEPEAFTNPAFPRELYPQIESIVRLREIIEPDIQLIVREHPAMYDAYPKEARRYLDEQRSTGFIRRLEEMKGVAFCNPDLDTFSFITNSKAVFCACGSASFEALLLRRPLIGIQFNPLSNHCGFINLREATTSKIERAEEMLMNMKDKILAESLIRDALPGSPNGRYNMFYKPDEESNSLRFYESALMALSLD